MAVLVGTAGWAIGKFAAPSFPSDGGALERYSAVFPAVEINSSFHRPHRPSTWERWRDTVPEDFQFSVKIPKLISHQQKLIGSDAALDGFVEQVAGLGQKLAVLLLQLPPKLEFESKIAAEFLELLSRRCSTQVVCEPRHPTWFEADADALLSDMGVARVAADPARHPDAADPGGWRGFNYFRLHGSPNIYRSSYGDRIGTYAQQLRRLSAKNRPTWCIFDNTASSAAISDALLLQDSLR